MAGNKRVKILAGFIVLMMSFSSAVPLQAADSPEDLMKQYYSVPTDEKALGNSGGNTSANSAPANVPTGSLSGTIPLSQPPVQKQTTPVTNTTATAKFSRTPLAVGSVMLDTAGNVLRKPTASFTAMVANASAGTKVRVTLKKAGASTDEKPITFFLTLMGTGLSSTGSGQYSGYTVLPVSQDRKYQYSVTFEMLDAQDKPVAGVPAKTVPLIIRPEYFGGDGNNNNYQNQAPTINGFSVSGGGELENAATVRATIENLPQGVSSTIYYQKQGASPQSVVVSGATINRILTGLSEDTDYDFWIEVPNGSDVVKSNVVTFHVPKKAEEVKILSFGAEVKNVAVRFNVTLSKEANYVNVIYQEKLVDGQLGPKRTKSLQSLGGGKYEGTLTEPYVKAGTEYVYLVQTQSGNRLVQSASRSFKVGQHPPFVQPTIKTVEVIKNATNRKIVTIKASFNDMPSNASIWVIAVPKGKTISVDSNGNFILPDGGVQSSARPLSSVNPNFFGLSGIVPGVDYEFIFVGYFFNTQSKKQLIKVYEESFTFRT